MRLGWPLVGRAEEMRLIAEAVSGEDAAGVVVCGAAGVGKSRIVREALDVASAGGAVIRWAVASQSAKELPFGALAAWTESGHSDSLELVKIIIEHLTGGSGGAPVIVGVDDVHLLDDLSAFVLHQISARKAAKLVVTVRDGEPVPVAVQDLWKNDHFVRLDLQPLSMDESTALLEATLGSSVDPDAARRLWKLTRGNVLYLKNVVEQEIGDGRILGTQGYWRWSGEPVLAPGLVELVDSRMGALPAAVSEVVDVLAVGEPVELAALSRITSAEAVEDADVRGLIALDDVDGRVEVRIAHPLYGEVRRNRAPATRLRRLRGLVAAELAASDRRDDLQVVVRRAALSLDADLKPPAELFVRAAHGAAWQVDVPLAERLADAAVRAGGGADAMFIHSFLLSWLGRGADAEALLDSVRTGDFDDAERDKLVFARVTNRLFSLADPEGALRALDESKALSERRCTSAATLVYSAASGDPVAAHAAAQAFTIDELPDVARRMAAWAIAVAAGDSGRTSEAKAAAEAGYPIGIRGYLVIVDAHLGACLLAGEIEDSRDVAEMLRQRSRDYPSPQLTPVAVGVSGRAALGAGRLDEALTLLTPTVEQMAASGEPIGWTYRYLLPLVCAHAMAGHAGRAEAALADLDARRHPGWRYLDYEYALARAWVSASKGLMSEAVQAVTAAAAAAGRQGQFAAEVMCLQTAVQFGDSSGAHRLDELSRMVEGSRAPLAARFAAALANGDAEALGVVSADLAAKGDLIAAADAASYAAAEHRRHGRRGAGLTWEARAAEFSSRCGGADTPALRLATDQIQLTRREREIVILIREGLSNGAIAVRLDLSVRTVEGHVYRAMAKTGAVDRDQLAAMLPATRD